MISDFIYLLESDDKLQFYLQLPDIFCDNDNSMTTCGNVEIIIDEDCCENIYIELYDEFYRLLEGDVYNRDSLIISVIAHLKTLRPGSAYYLSDVCLKDNEGIYRYSIYE